MVKELCERYSIKYLAQEFGVTERQVSNWRTGDRPLGFTAINVYLFHAKLGSPVQEK